MSGRDIEFACPLCGGEGFDVAPFARDRVITPPIYKCARCHFHFTDPRHYPKRAQQPGAGLTRQDNQPAQ